MVRLCGLRQEDVYARSGNQALGQRIRQIILDMDAAPRRVDEIGRRLHFPEELYRTIGYADYEALDQNIVRTIIPQGTPQNSPI